MAPAQAGGYRIALVLGQQTEAKYLASATNWDMVVPRWSDGNDIRDWGAEQFALADSFGQVHWPVLDIVGEAPVGTLPESERLALAQRAARYRIDGLLATTIEVVVDPGKRPGSPSSPRPR